MTTTAERTRQAGLRYDANQLDGQARALRRNARQLERRAEWLERRASKKRLRAALMADPCTDMDRAGETQPRSS